MKVKCGIEDFLSTLETFKNQGVTVISLDIDSELEGVKVTPINKPDIHPKTVGKQK